MKTLTRQNEQVTLPKGKYVIADACYVLDQSDAVRQDLEFYARSLGAESWDSLDFDLLSSESHGAVEFNDGTVGVYLPTAHGDGSWSISLWQRNGRSSTQHDVAADAGNVSIIPLSQIATSELDTVFPGRYVVPFEIFGEGKVSVHKKGYWSIMDDDHLVTSLHTDDVDEDWDEDDYDDWDDADDWEADDDF